MNLYDEQPTDKPTSDASGDADGMNTMAVLNTLGGGGSGGGEDVLPEGEPLGLDPEASKAKVSGSSLAVGVVVALGAVALIGMKLTIGALGGTVGPDEADAAIGTFLEQHKAAMKVGADGPIKAPDADSKRVLDELKQNPTDHQVPPKEVKTDPFDFSEMIKTETKKTGPTKAKPNEKNIAINRAKAAAGKLKVDAIAGDVVFINGEQYKVGQTLSGGMFTLESVDGLTCVIKTTDQFGIRIRLRYK